MSDEPKPPPPVVTEEEHVDRSVIIGLGGRWVSDWALRLAILLVAGWLLIQIGGEAGRASCPSSWRSSCRPSCGPRRDG